MVVILVAYFWAWAFLGRIPDEFHLWKGNIVMALCRQRESDWWFRLITAVMLHVWNIYFPSSPIFFIQPWLSGIHWTNMGWLWLGHGYVHYTVFSWMQLLVHALTSGGLTKYRWSWEWMWIDISLFYMDVIIYQRLNYGDWLANLC